MSQQTDEETRSRGRPLTPEADLRAALAEATLTLLLKGGYGAATVDAVAKQAELPRRPSTALPPTVTIWWRRRCAAGPMPFSRPSSRMQPIPRSWGRCWSRACKPLPARC